MVKLLVFAILLASSPATGLMETYYDAEVDCYSRCGNSHNTNENTLVDACKKGCDFKLLEGDCATKCNSMLTTEAQASCQVGCTFNLPAKTDKSTQPLVAIDPAPETKETESTPAESQPERPRSIILIRLRQRPSMEMPSMHQFFNADPMQMFNDMIKQFQERAKVFEQSISKSLEEKSDQLPKFPDFPTLSELPKSIPIVSLPVQTSESSSEEKTDPHPFLEEFRHVFTHPRGFHHQHPHEHMPHMQHMQHMAHMQHMPHMPHMNNRFRQFWTDVRTEWNDLVQKQPKIPIWIFLAIFLASSAMLWYMVMSLCHHAPPRDALSIRAQELVFHPYDYEGYEKEKIQPDDQPYEVTESLPIKVKLTNI